MLTIEQKLESLKNYETRYELALIHADGRRYLICYMSGYSRRRVFGAVTNDRRVTGVIALTGTDSIHFCKRSADGATMGEWTIRLTGRTQRESYLEGELPYVGDYSAVPALASV